MSHSTPDEPNSSGQDGDEPTPSSKGDSPDPSSHGDEHPWDSRPPPPPTGEGRPADAYDQLLPHERAKAFEIERSLHDQQGRNETGCGSMAGGACLGIVLTFLLTFPVATAVPFFNELGMAVLTPILAVIVGIIIALSTRYKSLGWGIALGPVIASILFWGTCITLVRGMAF